MKRLTRSLEALLPVASLNPTPQPKPQEAIAEARSFATFLSLPFARRDKAKHAPTLK